MSFLPAASADCLSLFLLMWAASFLPESGRGRGVHDGVAGTGAAVVWLWDLIQNRRLLKDRRDDPHG
jgi:hypothetical protein